MKKLFVSTGLAAIGIAGMQSAYGQGLDVASPKAWNISGTLRGFYDDNYNISSTRRGSWGTEVSPTVSVNVPLRQTDMGIRYTYGLYYYNDRDQLGVNPFDMSHQVDIWLDHAINERWKLNFTDTFVSSDQPDLTVAGVQTYRVDGNNIANQANVSLDTQWTKLFGTSLSYHNGFYNYQNKGTTVANTLLFPPGTYNQFLVPGNTAFQNHPTEFASLDGNGGNGGSGASLAGLLDRVEQSVGLDFNWTFSPETVAFFGYTYSWVNYIGNEPIAAFNYLNPAAVNPITNPQGQQSYVYGSNSRDGASQGAHVGLTHQLTANITLNAVVGVSYSDNDNDPFNHSRVVSPTANVSMNYTYLPGSFVNIGVTQAHNATDVVQPAATGGITQYQDTTGVYADWNHRITEKLSASLIGQYTYSSYQGGANNNNADSGVDASVNVTYQFTRHFSADAGYNFDELFSGLAGRQFVRNRVYMGLSANY
ncbi:MAG TPA: outer membrane beta-barrel protein [Candidatus Acidoferrales bacterium]|nr:outer membrane beta-barrel protein [Candidatus Acidoferrales bacterium]